MHGRNIINTDDRLPENGYCAMNDEEGGLEEIGDGSGDDFAVVKW